jgi:hypothetical protein
MCDWAKVLQFYYNCRFGEFRIFHPILANQYKIRTLTSVGPVAQRLEQRTHNVPGHFIAGLRMTLHGNALARYRILDV